MNLIGQRLWAEWLSGLPLLFWSARAEAPLPMAKLTPIFENSDDAGDLFGFNTF